MYKNFILGVSPSGKATAFGAVIRRFESFYPIHFKQSKIRIKFNLKLNYLYNTSIKYKHQINSHRKTTHETKSTSFIIYFFIC